MTDHKIVLVGDHTLSTEYRDVSLFGFLACAPSRYVPEFLFNHVFAPVAKKLENGETLYAQYGLRKLEAALLKKFKRSEIIVAHPHALGKVVGNETKVVGINAMDPLGLGPVTSSFSFGKGGTPYNKLKFMKILEQIREKQKKHKFRIVIGGGGAWQFQDKEKRQKYGIEYTCIGEADRDACNIMTDIIEGKSPEVIKPKAPKIEEIPVIVKPSICSLVEVNRGCGRGCKYCEPNMRYTRHMPVEKIKKEVLVNITGGQDEAWLQSEDILLYECDNKDFYPNRDAVLNLYTEISRMKGIKHVSATHTSFSAVVAGEETIKGISKITNAGPKNQVGVQPGVETGSPAMIEKYMKNKAMPFSPDEWPDVVRKGMNILNDNYWFPACTLIIGLPGETKDDVKDTIRLVESLDNNKCILATLFFTPLAMLKEEKHFRVDNLDKYQWELVHKCWMHNLRQFNRYAWLASSSMNVASRVVSVAVVKLGTKGILRYLNKYGKKFEREK